MDSEWEKDRVTEIATGRTWRVLERYLLPGKDTGYVLVCSNRACFSEIRGIRFPLGRLPSDFSPEDRAAVVQWAVQARAKQARDALRYANSGEEPPPPLGAATGHLI